MTSEECKIVPEKVFLKIRGNDKVYEEALEASAKFNKQLTSERKMRIPFIDSQTRVAQSNSLLWYMEYQRARGNRLGQLVSYPVKKWYKNRRRFLDTDSNNAMPPNRINTPAVDSAAARGDPNENSNSMDAGAGLSREHSLAKQSSNTAMPAAAAEEPDHKTSAPAAATAAAAANLDDWHMHEDSFDTFDVNEDDSDGDDYEESRKKKGKKSKLVTKRSKTAASAAADHDDKPFACDRCGMKYKTKPGLSYHIQKTHASTSKPSEVINADENANSVFESVYEDMNSSSSFPPQAATSAHNLVAHNAGSNSAASLTANGGATAKNPFGKQCGICLGSEQENRSNQPEQFVACCECTKNFHPTCLKFTPNMITSVKKYNWQCVDCKHCTICGNSENDDKLLFCDDCDRGYHMYCLKPPLTEAPDGDWRCELCIKQFGPQ